MSDISSTTNEALYWKHVETVRRKHEMIDGKKAILNTWLMKDCPFFDAAYIRDLKKRIRCAEVNLAAMRPMNENWQL